MKFLEKQLESTGGILLLAILLFLALITLVIA
jgi:hypothetical protein